MEQQIQYVTTDDGLSIACSAIGSGPTFVYLPDFLLCHLQRAIELPTSRAYIERFTAGFRVVRFDPRGTGMSDREVEDLTLEARLRDLEAVIDRLGDERVILYGAAHGATPMMAYAARHPERVSHLILADAWHGQIDHSVIPRAASLRQLLWSDWELFVENQARITFGWDDPMAREIGQLVRDAVDGDVVRRFYSPENLGTTDVTELLPQITARTLVIYHSRGPSTLEAARSLASRINGAQLHTIDGTGSVLNPVVDAVYGFTGVQAHRMQRDDADLRTILFADIEEHSTMLQRLGDEAGRAILREVDEMTAEALRSYGGTEIRSTEDGLLALFGSARRALECAISLQRAFAARNESAVVPVQVRIGISAGEPIAEEQDVFGAVVIAASRISAQARGGEILVANVVRELAAGKGFLFGDRGTLPLRGMEEPVRIFELRWQGRGAGE